MIVVGAEADYFVGTLSSHFGSLAFELSVATKVWLLMKERREREEERTGQDRGRRGGEEERRRAETRGDEKRGR